MGEATHLPLCAGYNWVLTAMAGPHKGKRQYAFGVLPFCVKTQKMFLHMAGVFVIMAIFDRISDPNEYH